METRFAISTYPDAAGISEKLDALIKSPIYSISRFAERPWHTTKEHILMYLALFQKP
ncbi:hypothetical protein [Sphaerochaeta sp.]|uniref:hypothetical protein n=1 Tax=Sphaerochaeta sp. TaxID=1972642 RepID=UPI003D0AD4CC